MHDPIQQPTNGKVWLGKESPATDCLREIIFDTRWLNSLPFYVKNRYTCCGWIFQLLFCEIGQRSCYESRDLC